MAFQHKYNTDNIHSRAIIVGLINMLNNKIQYENQLSNTEKDVIEVPWFFAKSVDERFLQDYFTFWSDCIHPKLVDGNYDITPRGIITLTSKGIESSSLTQRFVRGSYVKEIDGKLETFNSYLNAIPLKMNFDCSIICSSYTDGFKIEQALLETFYKVQVFNVSFKGFRIPAQVGFPEDYGLEKNFEYSYGDDNETTISFSLELETFYPVMDKTSERHESNRMSGFSPSLSVNNLDNQPQPEIKQLTLLSPSDATIQGGQPETYYTNSTLPFRWSTIGSILRVDLEYSLDGGSTWKTIQNQIVNSGAFDWLVESFTESYPTAIPSQEGQPVANLRPIANVTGSIIDIVIFDGGLGYDNTLELSIEENKSGIVSANIEPLVTSGKITGFNIIDPGSGYTPSQQFNISFRIKDSNTQNVIDVVNNVLII
jgi:hypothetical protein